MKLAEPAVRFINHQSEIIDFGDHHISRELLRQKIFGRDVRLFQDRSQRAFRKIAWMIGNCRVAVRGWIEPDLMASGCLAVEHESERLQLPHDLLIAKARETTQRVSPLRPTLCRRSRRRSEAVRFASAPPAPRVACGRHRGRFRALRLLFDLARRAPEDRRSSPDTLPREAARRGF